MSKNDDVDDNVDSYHHDDDDYSSNDKFYTATTICLMTAKFEEQIPVLLSLLCTRCIHTVMGH